MALYLLSLLLHSFLLTLTTANPLEPRQATNGPHAPTIIWSCTANPSPSLNIPSACKNMCYGAYCRGYGTSLTWDDFAGHSFAYRKRNAGCMGAIWDYGVEEGGQGGWWDRCFILKQACSTYPFLSTAESDTDAEGGNWGPVSRCVDAGEDSRQGVILYSLYASMGSWTNGQGLNSTPPARFHQIFANAGEIDYCSTFQPTCDADGQEADRMGQILTYSPLPPSRHRPQQRTWRLKKSGSNITASHDFEIGDKVVMPRVKDDELFLRQSENHVFDVKRGMEQYAYMAAGNLWFEHDEIEGEVL